MIPPIVAFLGYYHSFMKTVELNLARLIPSRLDPEL